MTLFVVTVRWSLEVDRDAGLARLVTGVPPRTFPAGGWHAYEPRARFGRVHPSVQLGQRTLPAALVIAVHPSVP